MKATFSTLAAVRKGGAPIALVLDRRWAKDSFFLQLDRAIKGALAREAKRQRFRGRRGEEATVQTHGAVAAPLVLLIGGDPLLGATECLEVAERLAAMAARERSRRVAVVLPRDASPAAVRSIAEGAALAAYRFDEFRSTNDTARPFTVAFAVDRPTGEMRAALQQAMVRSEAVCLARDLANTPAASLTPALLAKRASTAAAGALQVRTHDLGQLEKLGMGAIVAVGQGSRNPPCLIEMRYEPKAAPAGHIALVGKGITFDSGGLSIKPAGSMEMMKRDMAGGATVIATIVACARLALPLRLRGYVPAAENMPDGNAIRPGDVVRSYSGKTIEILNTDAEGRLVLADALAYAAEQQPRAIIDCATLTGAVRIALGKRYAAVMGTQQALIDDLLRAARDSGEGLWQLPLVGEYRRDIENRVADIKNTGDGGAGTIIAGLFLREFVGDTPWAHIDFSSTVMSDGYPCHPEGASGYAVRTLVTMLAGQAQAGNDYPGAEAGTPVNSKRK